MSLRRSVASTRLIKLTGITSALAAAALIVTRADSLSLPQDESDRSSLLSSEGPYPVDSLTLPNQTDVLPLLQAGREIQVGSVFVSIDCTNPSDPKIVVRRGSLGSLSFSFTNDLKREWFKDVMTGDTKATLRRVDVRHLVNSDEEVPAFEFKASHRGLKFIGKDVSIFPHTDLEAFLRALTDADPAQNEMCPPIAGYFSKNRDEYPMGVRRVSSSVTVAQK